MSVQYVAKTVKTSCQNKENIGNIAVFFLIIGVLLDFNKIYRKNRKYRSPNTEVTSEEPTPPSVRLEDVVPLFGHSISKMGNRHWILLTKLQALYIWVKVMTK